MLAWDQHQFMESDYEGYGISAHLSQAPSSPSSSLVVLYSCPSQAYFALALSEALAS